MSDEKLGLRFDRLYDVTPDRLRKSALRMLHRMANRKPEDIVIGISTLFILICQRYRVEPRAVLEVAERILRDMGDKNPPVLRGMKRYLKEDLPDA